MALIERTPITRRDERLFGIAIGGVLTAVGAALWWHGKGAGPYLAAAGTLAIAFGIAAPRALRVPASAWMAAGRLLHAIVFVALAAASYWFVFTPIGLLRRLAGSDALALRRRAETSAWRDTSAKLFRPEDMERPF